MKRPLLSSLALALAALIGGATLSGQAQAQAGYAPNYANSYDYRDPYDRYDRDPYDRYERDRYDDYDRHDRYQESRYVDHRYRDQRIHDRVQSALYSALGRQARGVSVRVSRGNVYLSGRVRSPADRALAHDVAHSVRGVHRVFSDRLYAPRYRY